MSAVVVLERVLSRIYGSNDPLLLDTEAFDHKVGYLFDKKTVKDGIKEYLSHHATSPKIMAFLIYSTRGREYLLSLLNQHVMPSSRLYDPLAFDGSPWVTLNAPLPIFEDIASGGGAWDFKPEEWFNKLDRFTAFPGVAAAMVERFRRRKRIDQVYRHMSVKMISDFLEHDPQVFSKDLDAIPEALSNLINPDSYYKDMAVCLVRTYLDKTESLAKILGTKPIPRD
jgi:hypothetical protein